MEEVVKHNNEQDAWTVIDGMILDVTKYLKHPEGQEIKSWIGKDATDLFKEKYPGMEPEESMLIAYFIGYVGEEVDDDE